MSYWTGTEVVTFDPEPWLFYPNWERMDCTCCRGIVWGGGLSFHTTGEPEECDFCMGTGCYARHKSGALAVYPGGPFRGRE